MARVFVLGNASIDTTLRVARLPVPGETLMAAGLERAPGGKGFNQAVMAARAGVAVRFCAPLGGEPETRLIREALVREGLAGDMVESRAATDLSMLLVDPSGENCIVSTGACADALTEAQALAFVAGMDGGDWLLLQGNLGEAVTVAAANAAKEGAARGRVMLNTAPLRWDCARLLPLCDVVVANRVEARAITGCDGAAAAVALRAGGGIGIVTMGAAGCVVAAPEPAAMASVPATAVDTTGAGDVFCGVLAAGLALGWAVADALAWAQGAAALSVTRAGCFGSFPSRDELAALRRLINPDSVETCLHRLGVR